MINKINQESVSVVVKWWTVEHYKLITALHSNKGEYAVTYYVTISNISNLKFWKITHGGH